MFDHDSNPSQAQWGQLGALYMINSTLVLGWCQLVINTLYVQILCTLFKGEGEKGWGLNSLSKPDPANIVSYRRATQQLKSIKLNSEAV